jgi:hypothetical protein
LFGLPLLTQVLKLLLLLLVLVPGQHSLNLAVVFVLLTPQLGHLQHSVLQQFLTFELRHLLFTLERLPRLHRSLLVTVLGHLDLILQLLLSTPLRFSLPSTLISEDLLPLLLLLLQQNSFMIHLLVLLVNSQPPLQLQLHLLLSLTLLTLQSIFFHQCMFL